MTTTKNLLTASNCSCGAIFIDYLFGMKVDRARMASLIIGSVPSRIEAHEGGYKTFCTSAILGFFGISKSSFKFSQNLQDMGRIFNRNGWRMENMTVKKEFKQIKGRAVKNLNKFNLPSGYYLIAVKDHVLLTYLDGVGNMRIQIDTHLKENDLRRVEVVYKIKLKK